MALQQPILMHAHTKCPPVYCTNYSYCTNYTNYTKYTNYTNYIYYTNYTNYAKCTNYTYYTNYTNYTNYIYYTNYSNYTNYSYYSLVIQIQRALWRKLESIFSRNNKALRFKRGQRKCACIRGQILPTRKQ